MERRVALLLSLTRQEDPLTGVLRVSDVQAERPLAIESGSLILTLECDDGATFSRGRVFLPGQNVSYPIQSNAELVADLLRYAAGQG